jgi:MFS family permease
MYQSLIGASAVLGITIGAVCGGKIIAIGRRKTFLFACAVGIVGVAITLI